MAVHVWLYWAMWYGMIVSFFKIIIKSLSLSLCYSLNLCHSLSLSFSLNIHYFVSSPLSFIKYNVNISAHVGVFKEGTSK